MAKVTFDIPDTNSISDGFHTFGELYTHRIELWIALCRTLASCAGDVWKTEIHSDGSSFDGWFVLGLGLEAGEQITYHLPMDRWAQCSFAETIDKAPTFDGHTSADVLNRLRLL
jgi:hypothetical protein